MNRGLVMAGALAVGAAGLVLLRNDSVPVAVALLLQLPVLWAFAWALRNPPPGSGGDP